MNFKSHEKLKEIVDNFDVIVSNSKERKPLFVSLVNVPIHLAKQKAKEVYKSNKDALVIGADTIVICNKIYKAIIFALFLLLIYKFSDIAIIII